MTRGRDNYYLDLFFIITASSIQTEHAKIAFNYPSKQKKIHHICDRPFSFNLNHLSGTFYFSTSHLPARMTWQLTMNRNDLLRID